MVLRVAAKRIGFGALSRRESRIPPGFEPLRQWRSKSTSVPSIPTPAESFAKTAKQGQNGSIPADTMEKDGPDAYRRTEEFVKNITPFMVPTYVRPPPVIVRGEGCYLWDMEGRQYLDFTAGIAVTSLGHSDKGVSEVISVQSEQLIHASNLFHNKHTGSLSQSLVTNTLVSGAMRTATQAFICNSGTEANEAALKFARKVGHTVDPSGAKHEIVSFQGSFHGRTFGALSATPNPKYQAPFAPMVPGFKYGEYNDIEQLPTLITENTCGVIVEPIQGEGGVNVATPKFLSALRARCDAVGAVLIFDEIQCGLSRTGSLWAHSHPSFKPKDGSQPAHPDILTTAKALGNGFPIGATLISSDTVGKHINTGDHGTTFGGNPLACAVGNHVLTRLANRDMQNAVIERSRVFVEGLQDLKSKYPDAISEIRGRGLILGLQLASPYSDRVGDVVALAREKGLLVITAGAGCIRFVPPLIITDEEIRVGLALLEESMAEIFSRV